MAHFSMEVLQEFVLLYFDRSLGIGTCMHAYVFTIRINVVFVRCQPTDDLCLSDHTAGRRFSPQTHPYLSNSVSSYSSF